MVWAQFCYYPRACKPMMFWSRDTDPAATPSVRPKPPFEARGVDNIMKLRKVMPSGGDAQVNPSNSTSHPEGKGEGAEAETTKSIQDSLEGQKPKDVKAWLDFRVSWLRVCCSASRCHFVAPEDCVWSFDDEKSRRQDSVYMYLKTRHYYIQEKI